LPAEHESTLFRGNSFATRLLTAFARARGYHYLRATLSDLMMGLCRKPREFSLDFDPHAATADDDVGMKNLETVTEAFLNVISSRWTKMPKYVALRLSFGGNLNVPGLQITP
jgi:neurofibromin 1